MSIKKGDSSMFDIKKVLEKYVNEETGEHDFDAINKELQNQVNGIQAKEKGVHKKAIQEAKDSSLNELLSKLNFKDVHELTERVTNGFTAEEGRFKDLQNEIDNLNKLNKELETYRTKSIELERTAQLKDLGYSNKYEIMGLLQELGSKVNDENDFNTVAQAHVSANPLNQQPKQVENSLTGRAMYNTKPNTEGPSIAQGTKLKV